MSDSKYLICLDDDPLVFKIMERAYGMTVIPFSTIEGLRRQASRYKPEAVILDINLDNQECGIDAIPFLLKTWPFVPIIVITSDTKSEWVSQALAAGAKDFLKKPLDPEEVRARINLRRAEARLLSQRHIFTLRNTVYNSQLRQLEHNSRSCVLSPIEGLLFEILISQLGQTCSRVQLMRAVWGNTQVSSAALEKRISILRKNLLAVDSDLQIHTIQGSGYKCCLKEIQEVNHA